MGGSNSVENINRNFTEAITSTAVSSVQTVGNQALQTQNLTVDCTDPVRINAIRACQSENLGKSPEYIEKVCSNPFTCGADHITMNALLNVNLNSNQIQAASLEFQNKIKKNIEETAEQENGILTFDNDVKNVIETATRTLSENAVNLVQGFNPGMQQVQTLTVKGGTLSVVNLNTASNQVLSNIQNNSTVQKTINDLSTSIKQIADQQSGQNLIKILIMIIATVVGLLLVLGVVLWIVKKKRQDDSGIPDFTPKSMRKLSSFCGSKMSGFCGMKH